MSSVIDVTVNKGSLLMHSMYFKIYQDLACRYGGEVVIKVELDEDAKGPGAIPGLQFSLLCSSQNH